MFYLVFVKSKDSDMVLSKISRKTITVGQFVCGSVSRDPSCCHEFLASEFSIWLLSPCTKAVLVPASFGASGGMDIPTMQGLFGLVGVVHLHVE